MVRKLLIKYQSLSVVAKATMWFMFCGIMQKGVAFLTTPIFTRLLTTEQYGQYSLYNSWLTIFTIFCTFRLEKAVFNKGMSKYSEEREQYAASMQIATNILTVLAFCIYLIFYKWINSITELSTFLTCAMFIELLFHPAFSFYNLIKRYEYKYISVILVTLSYTVLNAVLGVIAVLIADKSYRGSARIISCVFVATAFGLVLYIYNFYRAHFKFKWNHIKFAVKFNIPLIPHYFSSYILDQSDRLMISKYCGQGKVGIYSVSYHIGLVLKLVTDSIHSAFTPWQYEAMKKGRFKDVNKKIFPIMLIVTALLIVFMAFAPEAVMILADKRYHAAVYAIPPVSASIVFISLYGFYSNAEFYFDANKFSAIMTFVGAALNLILNAIFIPLFGFVAAGYTTLICYTVFAFAHFIYANRVAVKKCSKSVFSLSHLIILTLIIYLSTIGISFLYTNFYIRYAIIALISILGFVMHKRIILVFKQLKDKSTE